MHSIGVLFLQVTTLCSLLGVSILEVKSKRTHACLAVLKLFPFSDLGRNNQTPIRAFRRQMLKMLPPPLSRIYLRNVKDGPCQPE